MDSTTSYSSEYLAFNQGPHIIAATWLMSTLALVGVGGRLVIRYWVLKKGSADDWWMFGGLAFLISITAMVTRMADLGGFQHEVTLSSETASTVRKLFWAAQPIGIVGSMLPKVSIGLQLLYILPGSSLYNWQRRLIYFSLASCSLFVILVFPMTFAQCSPASALWEPAARYSGQVSNPRCWAPSVNTSFFAFMAVWNAVTDIVLAYIPMALIMGLHIKALKKALLVNFLGARCFAFISGIVKASYIAKYGFNGTGFGTEHDFTWQAFNILLWQVAEQFCLCFCGSVPSFKAMFDRWISKRNSMRASQSLTYVEGSRVSKSIPEKDWFYERKCFEDVADSHITITTTIDVEHEQMRRSSTDTATYDLKTLEKAHVSPVL